MSNQPRPPVHAKPPIVGAIATAMGWRHPKTNELLVSVRGLLVDDKAGDGDGGQNQSTLSSQHPAGTAHPPAPPADGSAPPDLSTSASIPEGAGDGVVQTATTGDGAATGEATNTEGGEPVKTAEGDAAAAPADKPVEDPKPQASADEPAAAPATIDTPAADAPKIDNTLFKFEKTGDDSVVKVTLRAPNHHAYTKWVVDGADLEGARGNTVDLKVGVNFTANNAKGSFSGQATAA